MRLKVKCPDCGKTHLLRVEFLRIWLQCPSCNCDFMPAADALLRCPRCGSIVAPSGDCRYHGFSCLECGLILPEPWLARLRRRLLRAFVAPRFSL